MRPFAKINSIKSLNPCLIFLSLLFFSFILMSCSDSSDETTSSATPTPTPSATTSTNSSSTKTFNKEVSDSILKEHVYSQGGDNEILQFTFYKNWEYYVATYSNEKGSEFELGKDGEMTFIAEPPADSNYYGPSKGSKYCINPDTNHNLLVTGAEQTDSPYEIWDQPENQVTGLGLTWSESSCEDLDDPDGLAVFGLTQGSSINCRDTIYSDDGDILSQEFKTITNESDPLWINFSSDIALSCDFYKPTG